MQHAPGSHVDVTGLVTAVKEYSKSTEVMVASLKPDGHYRHNNIVVVGEERRAIASKFLTDQTVRIAGWLGDFDNDHEAHQEEATIFADVMETVDHAQPHRTEVRITGTFHSLQTRGKAFGVTVVAMDPEGFERYYDASTKDPAIGQSLAEMKSGDLVTLSGAISERQRERMIPGNPPDPEDRDEYVEYRSVSIAISSVVEHEPVARPAPLPIELPKQEREPTFANRVAGLFRRSRGDLDMVSPAQDLHADHTSRMSAGEPPMGGGTLSAMHNPQPRVSVARHGVSEARHDLETISRTDPSQPIERFDEMKPQHAQQESHHPGAYVAIAGEVVRTHDFEKMTTVTVKSELPDGFTRYNSVMLFDPAARRATAALREGDLVRLDARVMENVFEKNGRETYRTDVIANRIDRAEPGTLHEASLIISGELRRGMQSADKVTIGSLVSEGRDGEPRYHTLKAFDPQTRQVLESAQIGDQLTVAGTIGQNSYEKDGQKVYTTDMVADRVLEHVPASRPAPAPLPSSGNDQRPEHRPSNRPR
jgi:single-stranded DNA-binding protein